MPWVRFTRDFDFKPSPRVTIAYKEGQHLLVKANCAEAAVAAGAGEIVSRHKPEGPADADSK